MGVWCIYSSGSENFSRILGEKYTRVLFERLKDSSHILFFLENASVHSMYKCQNYCCYMTDEGIFWTNPLQSLTDNHHAL